MLGAVRLGAVGPLPAAFSPWQLMHPESLTIVVDAVLGAISETILDRPFEFYLHTKV